MGALRVNSRLGEPERLALTVEPRDHLLAHLPAGLVAAIRVGVQCHVDDALERGGKGRRERRRALQDYLTGLLLDGEHKSIEPMAARLVEDEA